MSITIGLSGNIQATDNSTGSVSLSIPVANQYVGTEFSYTNTLSVGTSPTSITLPISPVQFLYIKNLATTSTLAVSWTKTGGSSQAILTLDPGGFTSFCENTASNGITAISLTASAVSTPVQIVLAG